MFAQGRGSLHVHGLFWGGLPARVMQLAAGTALQEYVATVLESMINAEIPEDEHARASLLQRAHDAPHFCRRVIQPSAVPAAAAPANATPAAAAPAADLLPAPVHTRERLIVDPATVPHGDGFHPAMAMSPGFRSGNFMSHVHACVRVCNLHARHHQTCLGEDSCGRCRLDRPSPVAAATAPCQILVHTPAPAAVTVAGAPRAVAQPAQRYTVLDAVQPPDLSTCGVYSTQRDVQLYPVPTLDKRTIVWELQRKLITEADITDPDALSDDVRAAIAALPAEDYNFLLGQLERANGKVVEYSPVLLAAVGSNSVTSHLFARESALACMWYAASRVVAYASF